MLLIMASIVIGSLECFIEPIETVEWGSTQVKIGCVMIFQGKTVVNKLRQL